MSGSKICRECGSLNGVDQRSCARCGTRFPSAARSTLETIFEAVLGREFPITRLTIGLCLFVFAFQSLGGGRIELFGSGRLSEALRWGALTPALASSEPWRLLSATFVHFGLLHIGFNLTAMVDLGKWGERTLGSARFCVIFVATAVFGFVVSCWWYADSPHVLTGGASGGIFGLVGTLIGYLYARKDPAWKQMATRVALYTLVFAFLMPVNNAAHLGGGALGLCAGYFAYKEKRPYKLEALFRGLAVACVAASFASIVLCHVSNVWRQQRAIEDRQGYGSDELSWRSSGPRLAA
jgi:membrane associated rhomboid family serine protease